MIPEGTSNSRVQSLINRYGLDGHPEDRFWARRSDLLGVGTLQAVREHGGRLEVEVLVNSLLIYLDTTNPACWGDLWNLERIPAGTTVAFSGCVRSFDGRGVRLGRLDVQPSSETPPLALFSPKVRFDGMIELGEGSIADPAPRVGSFAMLSCREGVMLATVEEARAHAS